MGDDRPTAAARPERYQPVPLGGAAQRLTIFVDETDRFHHKPVYTEIVHRAQQSGMAGASVFHGFEGTAPATTCTQRGSSACPRTFP